MRCKFTFYFQNKYLCTDFIIEYHMFKSDKTLYHLLAFVIIAIWGMTFISTRVLIEHGFSPEEIFLSRFLIAYLGICFISPRKLWCDSWKDELWMVVLGITGGSLYFWTENTAVGITLVTNVAFIVCTAPLLTALLSMVFCKKQQDVSYTKLLMGSITALAGVSLVVYNGSFVLQINPLGDFLSLLAALSWAFYSLIMNHVGNRYNMIFITRKVFFYGVLTILPCFLLNPWQVSLDTFIQPVVLFNILFLGVLASLICYYIWNLILRKLGALTASNYIYLNPCFTMLGSALFLSESMTSVGFLGAALILLGVYIAEKK